MMFRKASTKFNSKWTPKYHTKISRKCSLIKLLRITRGILSILWLMSTLLGSTNIMTIISIRFTNLSLILLTNWKSIGKIIPKTILNLLLFRIWILLRKSWKIRWRYWILMNKCKIKSVKILSIILSIKRFLSRNLIKCYF